MRICNERGFTLIEILAVTAIVAVLAAVVSKATFGMIDRARAAKEISAARKLIAAYTTATSDNDGILPPGYDKNATGVYQKDGRLVSGEPAHRYPWRMMPYLDGTITDALYVSKNRSQVDFGNDYMASLYPSFGMNQYFVGGRVDGETDKLMANDCVQRMGQASFPSKLLVFASARGNGTAGNQIQGYFSVTPPNLTSAMWTAGDEYDEKSSPETYGHLDLRHDKKAVCAFLDGHVALLGLEDLKDMRNWSNRAAETDNPGYSVTNSSTPSTGGGRY